MALVEAADEEELQARERPGQTGSGGVRGPDPRGGYTAVAAVDEKHQIIVEAQAHGVGQEQELLVPVVEALKPRVSEFRLAEDGSHAICPAGKRLYRSGKHCKIGGYVAMKFKGAQRDCANCALRAQCLRHPQRSVVRQIAFFTGKLDAAADAPVEAMKAKIDSDLGKQMIARRFATVEPVFGNIRHNKRLNRFSLRGRRKVDGQWKLYCLVHNIEKLAKAGYGMHKR